MDVGDSNIYKILIVDDESTIRRILNRRLSRDGYQCHEADCTKNATISLDSKQFDLVLLDITMPEQTGLQFLPEVGNKWPKVWVIMLTAVADLNIAVECMKRGAVDYITKPFDLDHVALSIRQQLEKRERQLQREEHRIQLESKLRAKFLHSVAHEIRTPLTSIICSAELLANNKVEDDRQKQNVLDMIVKNSWKLNKDLSNIITTTNTDKPENLAIEYNEIKVESIVGQAIEQVASALKTRNQLIELELSPNLTSIISDQKVCVQILSSLLSYSITFSPVGSKIIIRASIVDKELLFEVIDQSPKITDNEKNLLFLPGYQPVVASNETETGLGINFALAARLTSLISGDLWIKESSSVGNSYIFSLPIVPNSPKKGCPV
jgi:K+-sensing histidine kinase KdpD